MKSEKAAASLDNNHLEGLTRNKVALGIFNCRRRGGKNLTQEKNRKAKVN